MKYKIFLIALLLMVPIVTATTMDVYVRPLVAGNPKPNTLFQYEFDFSNNSICTAILYTTSINITTDNTGAGYASLDITGLSSTPKFICEYRNAALRAVHEIPTILADKIMANEIEADVNASRVLNPPWLSNETDPIWLADKPNYLNNTQILSLLSNISESDPLFIAENGTIWAAINSKLSNESDPIFSSENSTIWSAINNKYDKIEVYNKTEVDDLLAAQPRYAGFTTFNNVIDNLDGTLTIQTENANLYSNPDGTGTLKSYTLTGGTTGSSLPAIPQGTSYIVGDYNGGSPIFNIITNRELIHQTDVTPYITLYRSGNDIELLTWDAMGNAMAERINDRVVRTNRFARESGVSISEGPGRTIIIGSGIVWYGAYRKIMNASDSSTTETYLFYHNGTGWVKQAVTQYDNIHYDNGTALVDLQNSNYTVNWVYSSIEINPETYIVLGNQEHSSVAEAVLSSVGGLPDEVSVNGFLIGRIVVQNNASIASDVASAFDTVILSSAVSNHNDLSGLQGGAPGEYYHLTGAELQADIDRNLVWKTDSSNYIAGINDIAGTASFQVGTVWLVRNGNLTTGAYNPIDDITLVDITDGNTYGFDAGALINVTGTLYYVSLMNNATSFYIGGNQVFTNQPWSVKQAPYIDVSGGSSEERGYSWSDSGAWQFAQYIPDDSNNDQLCIASSTNPLGNIMCYSQNGTTNIMGDLYVGGTIYGSLSVNESDPVFTAENASIWAAINAKLNVESDPIFTAENGTIWGAINSKISTETDPIFTAENGTLLKTSGAQNLNGTLAISGQTTIGGGFPNGGITLTPDGDIWLDGSIYLTGNISSVTVNSVSVNGSFTPVLDATFNSGDPTHKWLNLYAVHVQASDANITGALYAGSVYSGGSLVCTANGTECSKYNDTAAFQAADNTLNATIQSINTTLNPVYGGIYFSAATTSMTLTTNSIWYNFTNWTLGESISCGLGSDNASLQCSVAGMYRISYVINNDINSADTLDYHLLINGVAEDKSFIAQKMTSGAAQSAVNYFHRRLNANDTIKLQVLNTGTNGKVLNIHNKNIIVERLSP